MLLPEAWDKKALWDAWSKGTGPLWYQISVFLLSSSFSISPSLLSMHSLAEIPLSRMQVGSFPGVSKPTDLRTSLSLFPLQVPPPLPLKGQHEPFLVGICLSDAVLEAGTGSSLHPGCLLNSWGFLGVPGVTSQVTGIMVSWWDVGTLLCHL